MPVTATNGAAPLDGYVVTDQPGDDAPALQAALDLAASAGGGLVYLPDRAYQLAQTVEIGSGTELRLSPGTTVHRAADVPWLLTNKHDGTTGGYDQAHDITITGGTWDGAAESYATNATMLMFGHTDRVTVRDTTLQNLGGAWHFLEFNAVRGGKILNSTFQGFAAGTDPNRPDASEMVQYDLARSVGTFPAFGPYDFTPTVDLLVAGNTFRGGMRGIGSHSQNAGHPHRDVRIVDNHFEDITSRAISPMNTDGLVVDGNTARDVTTFFRYEAPPPGQEIRGVVVQNNSVDNGPAAQDPLGGRGIALMGGDAASRRLQDVTVSGNVLDGMGKHGITVDFASRVTISDNTVRDTGREVVAPTSSAGIWIYGCQNATVVANQVVGTPAAANVDQADVIVGMGSGGPSDTSWVTVTGNNVGRLRVNQLTGGIASGNMLASLVVSGAPVNFNARDNVIGGAYRP